MSTSDSDSENFKEGLLLDLELLLSVAPDAPLYVNKNTYNPKEMIELIKKGEKDGLDYLKLGEMPPPLP